MTAFTWLLAIVSLIGVVLNIKKKKSCFVLWAGSNFCWMFVDYQAGLHAQAALFGVYFILSIYGLYEWRTCK
jgi:nicotinamide riboside transporter PnuC